MKVTWHGSNSLPNEAKEVLEFLEARNVERETALDLAFQERNLDITKYLIKRGVNVQTFSRPRLIVAGAFADEELIGTLLAHDLDINVKEQFVHTPLISIARRYPKDDSDEKEILAIAKRLIDSGASFSLRNPDSFSPLHSACHCGNKSLVKLFLQIMPEEEINDNNTLYGTPLCTAVFKGHLEIVRILLDAGADMSIEWQGQTRNGTHGCHRFNYGIY